MTTEDEYIQNMQDILNEIPCDINDRIDDQQRIIREGLTWINLLLRKNKDYGSSVWQPPLLAPNGDAILVRMSDKIQRLIHLSQNPSEVTFGASASLATDETFEDTIRDLGAYCLLYIAKPTAERARRDLARP